MIVLSIFRTTAANASSGENPRTKILSLLWEVWAETAERDVVGSIVCHSWSAQFQNAMTDRPFGEISGLTDPRLVMNF